MDEQTTTRKVLLWSCAVASTAAAGYFLYQTMASPISVMPDSPQYAQDFGCEQCGHVYSLTPRARAELMADQAKVEQSELTSIRRVKLPCPQCKAQACVAAATCPECGASYARRTKDGALRSLCPACFEGVSQAE
jgi:hypothetical protein